ncbi:MAG: hypothetical protein A2Z14_04090 [Chloroflexi bacterium RBG_16_48_8]|nr:MAG: hypothetical protein A2Z14_04090 [Chloroflexi bacterium RBG_16_48_8]
MFQYFPSDLTYLDIRLARLFLRGTELLLSIGILNSIKDIPLSQERDLRKYSSTTQKRLVFGVVLLVFILGDGLIYWIYGEQAGWMALICTGLGLVPVLLIGGLLWLLGWFVGSVNGE